MREKTRQAKIAVIRAELAFEFGRSGDQLSTYAQGLVEQLWDIGVCTVPGRERMIARSNPAYNSGRALRL